MTKLSKITATPEPEATDSPAGHTQMTALVDNLERFTVARFATNAARDAAIPAPTEGMLCWVTPTTGATPNLGGLLVYRKDYLGTLGWYPPGGTLVGTAYIPLTNVNTSTIGIYTMASLLTTVKFPFVTQTHAYIAGHAGFGGGGPVNWNMALRKADNTDVLIGPIIQSPAAIYSASALIGHWNNAPNANVGAIAVINFQSGSNIHTSGSLALQVFATQYPL
jgi:hypothetical protein